MKFPSSFKRSVTINYPTKDILLTNDRLQVGDYVICRKTPSGYPEDLVEGERYVVTKVQGNEIKINIGRWYFIGYFKPDKLMNERKDKLKRLLK